MKKIVLGDYIKVLTDYHSGGSYKALKENTKILYKPDYAVMIRTLNFERDDFKDDLIYCDKSSYDFLKYSHVKENDILMNKIANPGSIYIMPKVNYKVTCGMNLFLLRFKNINQRYMYYVMKYNEDYIKSKAHGTTTKTITKDEVRSLIFTIHDTKEEQDKVENILSLLDNKIENNNKINNNLEELMKTIYQRWFIEFEFPNEEGKPYKSNGGKFVYNNELKQEIPENWNIEQLNKISDFISGYAFSSEDYNKNGGYKLYTIKNVQDGNIVSSVDNNIKDLPNNLPKECILEPKDLIMSLTGNVGRVGIVYENNALLNQRVLKVQPKNNLCYLYSLCRTEWFKTKCEQLSSGTSQKNLSPIELSKLKIVYNQKIVEKFENENSMIIDSFVTNLEENQRLTELKNFLLPLLMNGQINVDDIKI